MDGQEIIHFIEPIFRFCHHRLDNWHDAEDLAEEILLHVLAGMGKYQIASLEAWVWRIAHNRYARFIMVEELIRRGRLEKPEIVGTATACREPGEEKPLANGVFYVEGVNCTPCQGHFHF